MSYKITSDSTCDLSPEQIGRYSIGILPLYVQLGDRTYQDGVDIFPAVQPARVTQISSKF